MSRKNCDSCNRFRSRTVAFRVSPEEYDLITCLAHISGLTKQDYLISRALQREINVRGSPRTYKALKDRLAEVLTELQRLERASEVTPELTGVILQITDTLSGFARVE